MTPRTKFSLTRDELLGHAVEVAKDYQKAGYDLTLRQLYYQLVSQALIPNSNPSYKRLGNTLGEARLGGNFDMDLLVDRGRNAQGSKQSECKLNVGTALEEAERWLCALPHWAVSVDRWYGQPLHVSVWVEKDALSGVFQKPCDALGVGMFACKGYPSHSALWQWLKKLSEAYKASKGGLADGFEDPDPLLEAVVLYFGDHDPDGWQIPRSAEEAINIFVRAHNLDVPRIRFERLGLNMSQIQKYNPPPFPAKTTSSRYASYHKEHGTNDAWELDALDVKVLDKLIRDNVARYWDQSLYEEWQRRARVRRDALRDEMREDEWVRNIL